MKSFQIGKIENLDALVNLKYLDLSYNRIEKLENLDALKQLEKLYLCHNKIPKIEGLDEVSLNWNQDILDYPDLVPCNNV